MNDVKTCIAISLHNKIYFLSSLSSERHKIGTCELFLFYFQARKTRSKSNLTLENRSTFEER